VTDKQCKRCGKVNPAEIHTCSPQVMTDKEAMQVALDALTRWQGICLDKNRSAKELTIPTKAIQALMTVLNKNPTE